VGSRTYCRKMPWRLYELLKARRDSVDHDRRQLTIMGKGNKQRVIDLDPFGGYANLGAAGLRWQAAPVLALGGRELQELRRQLWKNDPADSGMGEGERR
jgi:hypothetical protein